MFPSSYQPFNFSNTNGTAGFKEVSDAAEFLEDIREDWNSNYLNPSKDVAGDANTHGYYHLKDVPYLAIETVNPTTGASELTSGSLTNTEFIALTTNACHVSNVALLSTWGDPAEKQLDWLVKKLNDARTAGKTVIIAGSLPPGDVSCNAQWSNRFNTIIESFQDVVRLMLYGNTFSDSFQIIRSMSSGNPINVA